MVLLQQYKEKKKRIEKAAPPETKVRVAKVSALKLSGEYIVRYVFSQSEFFKSLASNLRNLRKVDLDKRRALYGPDAAEADFSSEEDDEYQIKNTRSNKRRRVGI